MENFGAISIDNNVLKANKGYDFDNGLLNELGQFKTSAVKIVQTDVIHNEAIKHIAIEITKAQNSISKALESAKKPLKIDAEKIKAVKHLLSIEDEAEKIADKRLRDYYDKIGAEVIESSKYIDVKKLMKMYFETHAPFELKESKKNEFPDAIALLSLENWAEENNLNVLAVSNDKGWMNYCATSKRITTVSDLSAALEMLQPKDKVIEIVNYVRAKDDVFASIGQRIADSLDGANIDIEFIPSIYCEYDDIYAEYISHQLEADESGLVVINVVHIDESSIVIEINATVACEVHANFSFSVYDSIDRDYVGVGSSNRSISTSYKTGILIELSGDFSKNFENVEVVDIEILETIHWADFGNVEPDYDE